MPKTVNGVVYVSNKTTGIPTIHDRHDDDRRSYCPMCDNIVYLNKRFESYAAALENSSKPVGVDWYLFHTIDNDTVYKFCSVECMDLYELAPILARIRTIGKLGELDERAKRTRFFASLSLNHLVYPK